MSIPEVCLVTSLYLPWLVFLGVVVATGVPSVAQISTKPLAWFKPDPNQPRKEFPEAELRQLGKSLRVKQIMPVLARPDGTLIDGERRLRAAELDGQETLDTILCEEPLSASQILLMQMSSAIHREGLNDWEQHSAAMQLIAKNPDWNASRLGKELGLEAPRITCLLSPSKCIESVVTALREGKISLGKTYQISKELPEEQARLLEMYLAGMSRDQVEHEHRTRKNGHTSAVRMSQVRIPLPSGMSVALKGKEMDMGQVVQSLADTLKAAKSAAEGGYDVRTWQRMMADKAKGVAS